MNIMYTVGDVNNPYYTRNPLHYNKIKIAAMLVINLLHALYFEVMS